MLTLKHINYDFKSGLAIGTACILDVMPLIFLNDKQDPEARAFFNALVFAAKCLITDQLEFEFANKYIGKLLDNLPLNTRFQRRNDYTVMVTNLIKYIDHHLYSFNFISYLQSVFIVASRISKIEIYQHTHNILLQILPSILEYKIINKQKFNKPEEVLQYLSESDRDKFLFNLDILI